MRLQTKPFFIPTIFCVLLALVAAGLRFSPQVGATTCAALPTDKGTAKVSFTVASNGTYQLWAHVYASASGGSALDLAIDNNCPISVGGDKLASQAFSWIDHSSGAAPARIKLASGTHILTVAGKDASVGIDRVLLLTNSSCAPAGDGGNCTANTTSKPSSAAPTPPAHTTQTPVSKPRQHKLSVARKVAYVATSAVAAALIGFMLVRYVIVPNNLLRRLPFFKSRTPSISGLASPPGEPLPFVAMPGAAAPGAVVFDPKANRKRLLLFILGFGIVGGLVSFIVLAAPNYSVVINLSSATVSGQAKVVATATAVNSRMVQFGSGSSAATRSKSAATATTPAATSHAKSSTSSHTSTSSSGGGTGTSSGSGSGSGSGSVTPSSDIGCNYGPDTWSGDASSVGYSVTRMSSSDGNPASFSAKINANPGTTEVVGYPSVQCLLYSALPANLASSFATTPPSNSNGLDYEYAYDIWLTTASAAESYDWNNDLELMIWTYVHGQVPLGTVKATLSDGSKVWVAGNNTTGTVSVVLPSDEKSGIINVSNIVSQLKAFGYVSKSYNGILDLEYGIEAPYGGGKTFTVNSLAVGE